MTKAVVSWKGRLREMVQSDGFKKQVAMALPKHMTEERMTRVALTALTRAPKLMDCTPESFGECMMDCSALGLEPDGRRAHLIPYGSKCTLIIDYKGLVELAMRSGKISHIHADVVCDNDEFEENLGRVVKHKIERRHPRGEAYAAYSHVVFKDGSESFCVMGKDEIESIQKQSKSGNTGPWKTFPHEMWKKTAFRRHSKWLSLSPEFQDAIEKEDKIEGPVDVTPVVEVSGPSVSEAEPVLKPSEPTEGPNDGFDDIPLREDDNVPLSVDTEAEPPPEPEDDPEVVGKEVGETNKSGSARPRSSKQQGLSGLGA